MHVISKKTLHLMTFYSTLINNYFNIYLLSFFAAKNLKMAAVPQAAFAARKIRKNEEKIAELAKYQDISPTKYNSKFMNSVWGMYNRYSVHNFKQNIDDNKTSTFGQQKDFVAPSVDKKSTDGKGSSNKNSISVPVNAWGITGYL